MAPSNLTPPRTAANGPTRVIALALLVAIVAAHADVVGVERDKWSVDPFAGVVTDGHAYGRGAIDFEEGAPFNTAWLARDHFAKIDAQLTRMHGNDERVSVESLRQGTEMIYRTLVRAAGRNEARR